MTLIFPSTNWLGNHPFTVEIRVRAPLGILLMIYACLISIPSYLKRWTPINNIGNTSAGGKRQYTWERKLNPVSGNGS